MRSIRSCEFNPVLRNGEERWVSAWTAPRWATSVDRSIVTWSAPDCIGLTTTVPAASSSSPTMTAMRGTAAVGELHLRLHRSVVEAAVGRRGRRARSSAVMRDALEPAGHVDDERVEGDGVGGEHALVVAGEQRAVDAEREARRRAWPARRAPRRARRSGPRHRARSGPSRACRPGTRRSCAGSSRGPRTSFGSTANGMSSARRPASTAAKCSAASGLWKSAICGAASITGRSNSRLESSTRSGLRSSVARLCSLSASPAAVKCPRSASTYAARSSGSPRLLTISVTCCSPSRR